jgi:hypothetical protein
MGLRQIRPKKGVIAKFVSGKKLDGFSILFGQKKQSDAGLGGLCLELF